MKRLRQPVTGIRAGGTPIFACCQRDPETQIETFRDFWFKDPVARLCPEFVGLFHHRQK